MKEYNIDYKECLLVRLHERFVIPQLLKQLAVYKITEDNFEEWLEVLKTWSNLRELKHDK